MTIRLPESIAEQILYRDSPGLPLVESFYAPCKEPHWQLVLGVQCSFLGQLFSQLESVGQAEESHKEGSDADSQDQDNAERVQYVWEEKLRRMCTTRFPFRGLGAERWAEEEKGSGSGRKVPFVIRRSPDDTGSTLESSPSRLFQLLSPFNEDSYSATRGDGDWTLFAAFVEEAVSQAQKLVDSLFVADCSQVDALSPPRLAILLQFFRALGAVLGLGWRAGLSPPCPCQLLS